MYPFIPNTMFYSPWQIHPNPRDQLTQQCNVSTSDFITRQMAAQCCVTTSRDALGRISRDWTPISLYDGSSIPFTPIPRISTVYQKPTIFDLYNAIFPVDPIRDYIADRIKAIEDKYRQVMQTLDRMGA